MFSEPIQKLIDLFSKFPTVGPRTAARFVFYLIKLPEEKIEELTKAIFKLKESIKICSFCFKPFQKSNKNSGLCDICSDPRRDKTLLCIVEKETDLESVEKTKKYKGLYFISGEAKAFLGKDEEKKIKIQELEERIKEPEKFGFPGTEFKEIIIAINPTTEGEATTLFLERKLKSILVPENKKLPKITRLGRGLPVGGELEYADEETLSSALESRR